ncbi:hypothetical protein BGW41_005428 [Actinomortierella wolfii]|nr:hypothetical protein BGW41_005428 [Actinomortierella wolfii]
MASSQGLARLREILQRPMSINAGNFIDRTSFQYVILPLIGVLTRENFCQSTMVQLSETIYAEVYRHKEMFLDRGVLACMRELINRRSMDDISPDRDELRRDNSLVQVASLQHAMLAVVRLVYQLLKRVTGAKSTMGETVSDIQTLVAACIRSSDNSEMSCFISHYLERECQRLIDMVSNTTHSVIEQAVTPTANLVHLKLSFDPPGHLSADGPRHNNDHALIKDIQIVPTQDELICTRPPFLPSNDVAGAPHHLQPGWARLLDTHFRLNREDMIDQLRQGILAFTDAMSKTSPDEYSKLLNRKELREILGFDVNLYVYGNVEFLGTDTSRSRQGMIRVSFDQPASINGEPEKKQAIFWERSKRRLMQGSLVCFIYPTRGPDANAWAPLGKEDFHLFLGVVAVRDIGQMTKDRKKATIHISLTHPEEYLRFIKACQSNKDLSQKCFMVESTGGFFEAYRPILRTLQTCEPAEMPFGKYLAPNDEHSTNLSIKSVDPPLYSRAPGFKFDLSSILRAPATYQLDTQDLESQRRAVSILRTHSTLDDTQAEALVNSLCREVALISGPPGTGKTKIGVDLMRVLVENAKQVNSGPILCICYTNHALDQFLDHLLDQGITNLVRIGARSQSDRLRQYALHALERAHAKGYAVRSAIAKNFEALEEATSKLEKLDKIIRHPEMQVSHILTHIEADDDYHYEDFLRGNPKDAQSKGIRSAEDNYRRWLACADLEHMMKQNKRLEKKLRKMQKKTMERYGLSDDESPSESQSESSLADIDAEPVPKRLFVIPNTNRPIHVLLNSHVWSMSKRERQRIHDFWSGQVQADLERKYTELQKQIQLLSDMNTAAYDEVRRRILCKAHVVGMTTNGAAKNQSMIAALSSRIIMCEEAGEVLESHILAALSGSTQHIILIGDHLQLRPQVATYELSSDSRLGCQYNLDRSLFERLVTTGKIPSSPLATQRRMRPEICNLVRKSLYEYLEDGEMVLAYPHVSGMAKDLFFMNHRHPEDNRDQYGIQSYANTFEAEMIRSLVIHLMKNGYQRSSIAVLTPYLGQLTRLRDKLRDIVRLQIDERDQYQLDAHEEETSTTNDSPKLVSTPQTLTLRTIDNFQGEEADIIIVSLVRSDTREDHGGISQTIGFLKSSNRTNVLLSRARHGMYLIGNARLMDQPKNGIWPKVMAELSRNQSIGDGFPLRCSNHPDAELLKKDPSKARCKTIIERQLRHCEHAVAVECHKDPETIKCQKECGVILKCGHPCTKKCSECQDTSSKDKLPSGKIQRDSSAMEMVVDVIMQTPLSEVDLNDDPLLVFSCGHALVMSSLDGLMGLSDYYESNTNPYTGITSFVKVKPLPHDEVSMVTCPSCRTPIVDLFRYGRRIKYSQLVKRLKHFEISQSQAIIDAEKSLASAQAAIGESLPAFLKKISESKAPAMKDPSGMTNRRLLGKFEQEGALFPNTDVESLLRSYDIPYKQESAWRGLIRPVLEVLKAFNMIQEQAINSPPRRLFEASVSHLYRFKSQVFYVGMAETGYETIQWSPEESERAIAESARECGLSPDHQAGSSFIRAIQGRTNALLLIMQAAVEAMEKGGEINSGWHWFVDDLLQCCLIHAVIQRDAAIKGCYHRIEMCACMTILNVLYRRMKWIGRWPFDKSDPKQLQTRQMAIDQVLEPFMAALRAIENSDRLRAEYLPKARQIESEIVTATKVALHQLHQPLTESEKFEIFLALQVQLSGTGHFYRCPNGHTYTIDRCGRAMQESTCPECGARVGGSHHQLTEGNQVDTEYESFYRRL